MARTLLRTIFLYIPLGYVAASVMLVIMLKWVPVYVTPLMVIRSFSPTEQQNASKPEKKAARPTNKVWTPIEEISENMSSAVVASEDQKFYIHKGFDYDEIARMMDEHKRKGKSVRGCSTISQQTAKNCFTLCTRTWIRKAIEAYYTILIEKIWGKERIMEVYLNVAEMGRGIYGAEAACQEYFGHSSAKMSKKEAASIAVCLPNPLKRTPQWVDKHMADRRDQVISYMQ